MDKLTILNRLSNNEITQIQAAQFLKLSTRQIRRTIKRIKNEGYNGIKRRPSGGNRNHTPEFKSQVITAVKSQYHDFGPTFASEKLLERDHLKINRETLRQWMIQAGLWKIKVKKTNLHQSRNRRSCFGELVQIDGSHHDWFEGRGLKCCLYVFIDDATSKIITMYFERSETTFGYFECIKKHVEKFGRPLAYYSDRHSIFITTRSDMIGGKYADTQCHRALRELNIELICAYSPQAKGRVERANLTLQDRLIKEMRLRDISNIEDANAYISEFIEHHNNKFAVAPRCEKDSHRELNNDIEKLDDILSIQDNRKLSKNLEFSFEGDKYQVNRVGSGYSYRGREVKVCKKMDGSVIAKYGCEALKLRKLEINMRGPFLCDRKGMDEVFGKMMDKRKVTHRAHSHQFPVIKVLGNGCGLVDNIN